MQVCRLLRSIKRRRLLKNLINFFIHSFRLSHIFNQNVQTWYLITFSVWFPYCTILQELGRFLHISCLCIFYIRAKIIKLFAFWCSQIRFVQFIHICCFEHNSITTGRCQSSIILLSCFRKFENILVFTLVVFVRAIPGKSHFFWGKYPWFMTQCKVCILWQNIKSFLYFYCYSYTLFSVHFFSNFKLSSNTWIYFSNMIWLWMVCITCSVLWAIIKIIVQPPCCKAWPSAKSIVHITDNGEPIEKQRYEWVLFKV